jgi:hypothetical protein
MPWAVRHAAWLLNRYAPYRRNTNCTPYNNNYQHEYRGEIFLFGQPVMGKLRETVPKLEPRWAPGVWLGRSNQSDEHLIGTANGILLSRSVKAMHRDDIQQDVFGQMQWTPWKKAAVELKDEVEEEKPKEVIQPETAIPEEQKEKKRELSGGGATYAAKRLREFHEEKGATPGCKACSQAEFRREHQSECASRSSQTGHQHSALCKRRRALYEEEFEEKTKGAEDECELMFWWLKDGETIQYEEMKVEDEEMKVQDEEMKESRKRQREGDEEEGDRMEVQAVGQGPPWIDGGTG